MWKIKCRSISLRKIVFPILFFLVIFNPPFLPRLSFTILFTLIALFYCILHQKFVIRLCSSFYLKQWMGILLAFFLYYFGISVFSELGNVFAVSPFRMFLVSLANIVPLFAVSFFLCMAVFGKSETYDCLVDYVIHAGLIESLFGIMAFVSPAVKSALNGIMIANSRSEKIRHAVNSASFRNYGIASTLFDSFGFAMSIMALLALYKAVEGKPKYYLYFLMIAFTASINARTSMILIVVGTGIIILGKRSRTYKDKVGKLFIVFLGVFAVGLLGTYLSKGGANAEWLSNGVEEIKTLVIGRKTTGTFAVLLQEIVFPENPIALLFGVGLTPAQAAGRTVDMGYIQNLWMFGIVGSVLLYAFYLKAIGLWWKKIKEERALALSVAVVIFVFFLKLNLFGYGISTVVLTTIFMGRLMTLPYSKRVG